jgi:hypothetical protein
MRARAPVHFAAALLVLAPIAAQARTIALLVGISRYDDPGITALQGPARDVAAMRDVVEHAMGAAPGDVHVLTDHQAGVAAIRAELTGLIDRSTPGDTVVIFLSGHGTSARDPNSTTDLPMGTSAFVPADFMLAQTDHVAQRLLTGRYDLLPLALKPLDAGGRNVIVISDSCYSGNIVRGVHSGTNKYIPIGDSGAPLAKTVDLAPAAYPYAHVVMLSASADTEPAHDLDDMAATPTIDGQPKGALTNALLRVFAGLKPADYNHDGKVSFVELQRAVREDLAALHQPQSPQLLPSLDQDSTGLTYAGVPGLAARAVAATAAKLRLALPPGDAALAGAMGETGEFAIDAQDPDLTVLPGYGLRNRSGDMIVRDQPLAALLARLRAGVWARAVVGAGTGTIALAADTQPGAQGGNFVIGRDRLRMVLKADRAVHYLVIDVDPFGTLTTLWPNEDAENRAFDSGQLHVIPDTPIEACDPAGLDHVVVMAFAEPPPGLSAWFSLKARFGTAQANGFVAWLAGLRQAPAATTIDVRTLHAADGGKPCGG